MKTCLYNIDPLKPRFYIVKLGFTGVYINFLISAQKHRSWVFVRTASPRSEAILTIIHNLCFEQKYENYQKFSSESFQFLVVKFSIYLNRRVFVIVCVSVISYMAFVLSLFGLRLFFFWYLRKTVIRDCDVSFTYIVSRLCEQPRSRLAIEST